MVPVVTRTELSENLNVAAQQADSGHLSPLRVSSELKVRALILVWMLPLHLMFSNFC